MSIALKSTGSSSGTRCLQFSDIVCRGLIYVRKCRGYMNRQRGIAIAWGIALLAGAFIAADSTQADDVKSLYPTMAPLDQYLMPDRQAEIILARSAAPAAISDHATVLVLERHGYEVAINGDNGFTCLVERSWMSPFDSSDFWNPKMREPTCYNPAAARSILPYTIKTTELVLARLPKVQINERIRALVTQKRLPMPEPGAMSFMMSRDQNLGDEAGHWHPHLMFHIPKTDAASWGANLPGSPVMLDTGHHDIPEPETIFLVPVGHWSDGAPDAGHGAQ